MLRIASKSKMPPVPEELPQMEPEADLPEPEGLAEALTAENPEAGGGMVDPTLAKYMGPDMRCGSCKHFQEPSTCDLLSGPVEADGVCMLFEPMEQDEVDAMPVEASEEEAV